MLVLLPPSEGKTPARSGRPLELTGLVAPELAGRRERVLSALVAASARPDALQTLGLSPGQQDLARQNSGLWSAPAAPAYRVYTGVLHSALGLATATSAERQRANRRLLILSTLFGVVRPLDRVPAYRLGPGVRLPRVGPLARFWRDDLSAEIAARHSRGLLIDLRSGPYVQLAPNIGHSSRSVSVKVWQKGEGGARVAVSHANKEVKGRLARALVGLSPEPLSPSGLVDSLLDLGWDVHLGDASSGRLDVLV